MEPVQLSIESSVDEVYSWLRLNGFQDVAETFCDEEIDGESLSLLTEKSLEGMVNKVGPRMKIMKVIQNMTSPSVSNSPNTSSFTDLTQTSQLPSDSVSLIRQPDRYSSTFADEISVSDYNSPQPSISCSPCNPIVSVRLLWESPFQLPRRFQPIVQNALDKKTFMTKKERSKFIQAIYEKICQFTISPTSDQRRDACRAIITMYPHQTDADGGYETWYKQLGDKVKNELRNEKDDPIVLARKRKSNAGTPPICKAKRGIVNWEPPQVEGEDEMSSKLHMEWMQKEYKKREPNMTLLYDKMTRTYASRRRYINESSPTLQEINDKYPFLFDPQQLEEEYNRLLADKSAGVKIRTRIIQLSPKLLLVADKRKLGNEQAHNLMSFLEKRSDSDQLPNQEDKALIAFLLLPFLLEKKTKKNPNPEDYLYQFEDDEEKVVASTKPNMAPFLVFKGCKFENPDLMSTEIYISAEQKVVLRVPGGLIEAINASFSHTTFVI